MYSSPCTYEFNWEDRAEEDFLKDMDNIGQSWNDGNPKAKYNFPDNPGKQAVMRRKHVLELKKFAAARASTGAELIVIRELTGMPTGFKPNELINNTIVVSQVCKSSEQQKKDAEAGWLSVINGGRKAEQIDDASNLLTGKKIDSQEDFKKNTTPPAEKKQETKPTPPAEDKKELTPNEKTFFDLLESEDALNLPEFSEHYNMLYKDNHTDDFLIWAIKDIPFIIKQRKGDK